MPKIETQEQAILALISAADKVAVLVQEPKDRHARAVYLNITKKEARWFVACFHTGLQAYMSFDAGEKCCYLTFAQQENGE